MSNTAQGDRQLTVRASTGTALDYDGDWQALFDQAGIAAGDSMGRLLTWINQQLSTNYADVEQAMQAFVVAKSNPAAINWSSMGNFTIGGGATPSDPVPIIFG